MWTSCTDRGLQGFEEPSGARIYGNRKGNIVSWPQHTLGTQPENVAIHHTMFVPATHAAEKLPGLSGAGTPDSIRPNSVLQEHRKYMIVGNSNQSAQCSRHYLPGTSMRYVVRFPSCSTVAATYTGWDVRGKGGGVVSVGRGV